ncbi:MAG: hypothetical protein M0025_10625 [Elusimicrobia bacterium]|nr:hypothetical protein [Elusimicrobiota bacterium]
MKIRLCALLLACAAPALAGEGTPAAGPPAVSSAAPSGAALDAGLFRAERDLLLIKERRAELSGERLSEAAAAVDAFTAAAERALGPRVLADDARRRAAAARKALAAFRAAIQAYYAATGGYPADLAALVPDYLPDWPELALPEHGANAGQRTADAGARRDAAAAVEDTGGWLYFSGAGAPDDGLLVIDCSHKDPDGLEFYKY